MGNYLLEPRVSKEDRLWAEQHYEVKKLNDKIEKWKKIDKVGIVVCSVCFLVCLAAIVLYFAGFNALVDKSQEIEPLEIILFLIMALFFMLIFISCVMSVKTGRKDLITQKNIYIETLVEERNLNQENNLSKGETNE